MDASPAVLADASGVRVALTIEGYEFPQADDLDDATWLMIGLDASDGQGRWTATGPNLQTWEVASLVGWLRAVAAGDAFDARREFIEPALVFEADGAGDAAIVTVTVAYDVRPPWLPEFEERQVHLRPGVAGLLACAAALQAGLAHFPSRGPGEPQGR
jgi:hypothetical protein